MAHTFHLSIQAVHPALDLFTLRDRTEAWSDAVGDVIMAGKAAAGVELSLKWPEIATCIEYARAESASPQFRDACFAKLRQLVPDLDSEGDSATLTTVGFLERILCSAVARREGPVVADKPRPPVFGYLAKWTWADQDWWLALPQTLAKTSSDSCCAAFSGSTTWLMEMPREIEQLPLPKSTHKRAEVWKNSPLAECTCQLERVIEV